MKQLSISTPTVIDTELTPFDESFYIDKNGQTDQWYYDNTEQYAPNRKIIPLMLTPALSVIDKDSGSRYNPNYQYVRWYANEWDASAVFTYTFAVSSQQEFENGQLPSDISSWSSTVPATTSSKPYVWVRLIVSKGPTVYETTYAQDNTATTSKYNTHTGGYVETEITNTAESATADYVISGFNLIVRKNVSYNHPVTIRCAVTYIDPRALGMTYDTSDNVVLTTNRTSDIVFPDVEIISPSSRSFNPLTDYEIDNGNFVQKSLFKFNGIKTNSPVQPLNTDVRRYPVDVDGTEEILNSGAGVAPIMDIRYGDNPTSENQEFMYRQTAGGTLVGESIDKAFIERIKGNTVAWNRFVKNGNFASGTSYWNAIFGTMAASGNILTYTVADATSLQNLLQAGFPDVSGHKYFFAADMSYSAKPTSRDNGFLSIGGYYGIGWSIDDIVVNSWFRASGIVTSNGNAETKDLRFYFRTTGMPTGSTIKIKNVIALDLTLIYGAGSEPTTVAQFEADYERWFGKPLSYEEYDEGSLRPVLMQSVKTTGFNQWDEQWDNCYFDDTGKKVISNTNVGSKGQISVYPNTAYYIAGGVTNPTLFYGTIVEYDASGSVVQVNTNPNRLFTTSANTRYIAFNVAGAYGTTYNHDICINISNPSKNGTYEPYEEKVQGFDVTAIKGKLNGAGNSVTIFPDGLKKVGNVQDEIFVEDGVVKAIKRVGSVDLGTLTWTRWGGQTTNNYNYINTSEKSKIKYSANIICAQYESAGFQTFYAQHKGKYIGIATDGTICVDSDIEDNVSVFTSSMQGVMLYYELATPETYVLDPITDFVWYGIENGQEVLADTLPWYVSGQGTEELTVDAMYAENIRVLLRAKMPDGETLSPSKSYASVGWKVPDIDSFVQSDNGNAVRTNTKSMDFRTIVNVKGNVLSDEVKRRHLVLNWKVRKNNQSTESDKGWGQEKNISANDLRYVIGSSGTLSSVLVYPYVYLLGPYEQVTDNNEAVTDNGEPVYDRYKE